MLGQHPAVALLVSTLLSSSILLAQTPHGGTIRGQVEDSNTSIIQGASVEIVDGDFHQQTKTGERGDFAFTDLPGGEYRILITTPGFFAKTVVAPLAVGEMWNLRRIQLRPTDSPQVQQARLVSSEASTGSIVAHVRSEASESITGARVDLRCPKRAACKTQVSNASGDVRFDSLPEGKYELKFSAKGFYELSLSVETAPGVEVSYPGINLVRCVEPTCGARRQTASLE